MDLVARVRDKIGEYRAYGYLMILFLYSLITLLMTYPLVLTAFSNYPGSIDIYASLWRSAYTGQFITQLISTGRSGYTNYIFYPAGIQVIPFFSAYNQFLSMVMAPLFGDVLTINILYISAFILSAYGAYLLAYHITKDNVASFISGIVFSFAPYHFAHAFVGHFGALTMQWIPFCALFLVKTFENKKPGDAILAAIFFILVAMSDLQYMVYMGMFVILFVLYGTATGSIKPDKRTFQLIMIFGVISLIGVLPFTIDMITPALSGDNYLDAGSQAMYYSNDLFSFFIPSYLHPIVGNIVTGIFYNHSQTGASTPWEMTAYAGVVVLLLSLYGAIFAKTAQSRFWIVSAVFFALMSLGPILHVLGTSTFFNVEIPMPYVFIAPFIPGLSDGRTPGRFDVLVVLSLAVLTGYGISIINKKIASRTPDRKMMARLLIPAVIAILILCEYLVVPFTTVTAEVPSFYHGLANDTADYAIMEIPATYNYTFGVQALYYQTIHHKYMVGGQEARIPAASQEFEANTPYVSQLTYMANDTGDIFDQNVTDIGSSILQYYNIRYVIVHRDYLTEEQLRNVTGFLNATPGLEAAEYSDGNMSVYRVMNSTMKPFMVRQDGWWGVENSNNTYHSWMQENGTVLAYSPAGGAYSLTFNASSFHDGRMMQVFVNGQKIYENTIPPSFTTVKTDIQLSEGKNTIAFVSPSGTVRPSNIPGPGSTDERNISFALGDIRIDPMQ